jgi:polar amino acid transport system substrate-binding protein
MARFTMKLFNATREMRGMPTHLKENCMKKTALLALTCLAIMVCITGCGKPEKVIASFDDAKSAKIGVMTGTTGETITKARFPQAQIKSFDDVMDAIAAIKSGQLDAVVTAYPTALQVTKLNPELRLLPEPLANEDSAIALRKDNDALLNELNTIIAGLKADGTLADMRKRWFKPDLSPYVEKDIIPSREGKELRVGVCATREPLSFVDKNGKVTGHDGELARIIAAKLHRPLTFYNMKFMALIPALQSNKVDIIVSGMTATGERKKAVNFSQPYFANTQIMLVRKPAGAASSPKGAKLNTPADLKDKRIAVCICTAQEAFATKTYPKATILQYNSFSDMIMALKTGKADAALYDTEQLKIALRQDSELGFLGGEPLFSFPIGVGFNRENHRLRDTFNQFLRRIKQNGVYDDMVERWMKKGDTRMPEIPAAAPARGELVVGIDGSCGFPFSSMKDNKVVGFDVELANRFAAFSGKKLKLANMEFGGLIAAVSSGKIDIIISDLFITEERKKQIIFSDPYYGSGTNAIALKKNIAAAATTTPHVSSAASSPVNAAGARGLLTLSQLDGKRICVLSGSAGDLAARKHFPHSSFQALNSSADAGLALKGNKADAFVYDKSVLLNLAEKNPELVILHEPVDKLEVAAAIKKENSRLLAEMNAVLMKLKDEGALQRLRSKWVDSKYAVTPQLPPLSNAKSRGVLKMGTCANLEPFSFQSNGIITGLDIELSRLLAGRLGKKIEIIDMNFEALIPALQSGKIDFALSNFNVTEERKKLVSFSAPYITNDISALVRRGAPLAGARAEAATASGGAKQGGAKLSAPDDLKDKRIGVLLGSIHDTYAIKTYPRATVLQYKTPSDLVLAVKSGKVDVAFYTYETLLDILRNDSELAFLGKPLFTVPIGVGFNKNNNQLREEFNRFLRQIKENGVFKDMVNRWITTGGARMPDIPNTKANGTLVAGMVSDKGLPFTILKDGKMIGFDVELTERFAAHLGKELKLADMEFGSLIAAAATNKIDMITSTLVITEERKKQVAFSDPYYELGASVFALKKNIAVTDGVTNGATDKADTGTASPSFFKSIANSFQSNIIQEKRYLLIWDGLKTTVVISVLSTLFGTLLGALVCFMRMSRNSLLNLPARVFISILRGTPVLVLLMLIFYVVFASVSIDPVIVAVIAFGMNFAAYVAEIFRTGIEGVDKGQTEAGIAMGFTKVSTFLHIVLPQTVRRILPVYKGEFISLVKMTSIVGYIAVQDLTKASDIIRSRTFDAFFPLVMVAILYFLISWCLMQSLGYVERVTDPKYKRRKAGNR